MVKFDKVWRTGITKAQKISHFSNLPGCEYQFALWLFLLLSSEELMIFFLYMADISLRLCFQQLFHWDCYKSRPVIWDDGCWRYLLFDVPKGEDEHSCVSISFSLYLGLRNFEPHLRWFSWAVLYLHIFIFVQTGGCPSSIYYGKQRRKDWILSFVWTLRYSI